MIVEHSQDYPNLVWGYDIRAKRVPVEEIEVSGYEVLSSNDAKNAHDLVRDYREANRLFGNRKRTGKNAPHLQFANAKSDEELFSFTQRFGPVVCSSLGIKNETSQSEFDFEFSRTRLIANQSLVELRKERDLYRAALALVAALGRQNKPDLGSLQRCIEQIADGVSDWPDQWERERQVRENVSIFDKLSWTFTKQDVKTMGFYKFYADNHGADNPLVAPDALSCARNALCHLLNVFDVRLYIWGDRAVEAPHWDLRGGIRPLLYYILRREYLKGSGIEICRNSECRQIFEIERSGQEFCSDLCSRRQRQRDYWFQGGKKARTRRLRAKKKGQQQKF